MANSIGKIFDQYYQYWSNYDLNVEARLIKKQYLDYNDIVIGYTSALHLKEIKKEKDEKIYCYSKEFMTGKITQEEMTEIISKICDENYKKEKAEIKKYSKYNLCDISDLQNKMTVLIEKQIFIQTLIVEQNHPLLINSRDLGKKIHNLESKIALHRSHIKSSSGQIHYLLKEIMNDEKELIELKKKLNYSNSSNDKKYLQRCIEFLKKNNVKDIEYLYASQCVEKAHKLYEKQMFENFQCPEGFVKHKKVKIGTDYFCESKSKESKRNCKKYKIIASSKIIDDAESHYQKHYAISIGDIVIEKYDKGFSLDSKPYIVLTPWAFQL